MSYAAQIPVHSTYTRILEAILDPFLAATTRAASDKEPPPKRVKLSTITPPSYPNVMAKFTLQSRHGLPSSQATIPDSETAQVNLPDACDSLERLRKAFLKCVFDAASQSDAREVNRKRLYAFWKAAVAEGDTGVEWDAS